MQIKGGCTRSVILIGTYAVKIPRLNYGWTQFIKGLLGNMQEVHYSKMKDKRICPVLFAIPGGFLLVMPRCKELSEVEFTNININDYWKQHLKNINEKTMYCGDFVVPVEHKIDSFGIINNNIVAIDYGSSKY